MALTQDQLAAAMYFAVGFGTEGGNDSFRLSIAGLRNGRDAWEATNINRVKGGSGYTVGVMQFDFGQNGLAAVGTRTKAGPGETSYVDAFIANVKQFGRDNPSAPQLLEDTALLRSQLLTKGKRLDFMDDANRQAIDAYVGSTEGKNWIHQNMDLMLVNDNSSNAIKIVQKYGSNWTERQQWQAAQVLGKLYNQSPYGEFKKLSPTLADIVEKSDGKTLTFDKFQESIRDIERNNKLIHATKAGEKGINFETALNTEGMKIWLESAMNKIRAPDFDARRFNTEADLRLALRVAGAGKVTSEVDAYGNPRLVLTTGGIQTTYTYDAANDMINMGRYSKTGKPLGGTCYTLAPEYGESAPRPVSGSIGEQFSELIEQIKKSAESAWDFVHDETVKALLDIKDGVLEAYESVSELVNQWINEATDRWGQLTSQLEQFTDEAGNVLHRLATGAGQVLDQLQTELMGQLEGLLSLPERISGGIQSLASDTMSQFRDLIFQFGDWLDDLTGMPNDRLSLKELKNILYDTPVRTLSDFLERTFDNARSVPQPRRDPLVFDLDNDGLETTGINAASPTLFDHDGDGIKTATGWVSADDAFLVLDRNANGTIDTGRELFGDSTPLAGGGTAADGFAALAQEDTNADGLVDASDARFADLHLWRDLNQDGISQNNELFTLTELGITSITVAKTEHTQLLPNGNQLADLGSYTRSDGSVGGLGEVTADLADIDLIEDTFHREFADTIPLTALAETLPDMQGSGQVRDLREAMSLGTPAADALAALVQQFAAATTAQAQRALVDQIIIAWGQTSGLAVSGSASAYHGLPTTISIAGASPGSAGYNAWLDKLQTLERFNGTPFATVAEGATSVTINLFAERQTLLNQSWQALEDSLYGSLVLQTRLKSYLDDIELVIDETGIHADFGALNQALATARDSSAVTAFIDTYDLFKFAGDALGGIGWNGAEQLVELVNNVQQQGGLDAFQSAIAAAYATTPGLREISPTPLISTSPIVLNLNGDGVRTTHVSQGVNFDHDRNGFAELSGWARLAA